MLKKLMAWLFIALHKKSTFSIEFYDAETFEHELYTVQEYWEMGECGPRWVYSGCNTTM